jgi:hypothetical protein
MKKIILLTAVLSSALTLAAVYSLGCAALPSRVLLDNARVRVKEVTYLPGIARDRYLRPTDQVIVFLEDCKYQRTDSKTGEKTTRQRKAGEVIWHDRAEDAPVLTNLGNQPYRTLTIELK